jgi:excisionase family DNA binding protein
VTRLDRASGPGTMLPLRMAYSRNRHQEEGTDSMTVAEAADALGVTTQTIYNYIYAGTLRARRPAGRYILRERDVATLIARRKARE